MILILILIHSCVWVDMSYICSVGESAGDLVVQGRVGSNRKRCMTRRWLFLFLFCFFYLQRLADCRFVLTGTCIMWGPVSGRHDCKFRHTFFLVSTGAVGWDQKALYVIIVATLWT